MTGLLFGWGGALEVRAASDGAAHLQGHFPYGARAVLRDAGPHGPKFEEQFAARAFNGRLDDPSADIFLLAGHDFAKPLASRKAGTLTLNDDQTALHFSAIISPGVALTVHGRDALALISEGLSKGVSPGFRVRSEGKARAETVTQEADGSVLRTIRSADLFELSVVTMPAYEAAQVEARNWSPAHESVSPASNALRRWRA